MSTKNVTLMTLSMVPSSNSSELSCDSTCRLKMQIDIKLGFAYDFDCEANKLALTSFPKTLFLSERYSWIIWSQEAHFMEFMQSSRIDLSILSDVTFAELDSSSAKLYDVYRITQEHALNITFAGWWRNDRGIQWNFTQNRMERRKNLHGLKLSAVILLTRFKKQDDGLFLNNYYKREFDAVPRRDYQFWKLMNDLYNFSSHYITSNLFGSEINKSYDGVIGYLQRKEVDVGISTVFQTIDRMEAVNFVHVHIGYSNFRPVFIFLRPKDEHGIWDLTESFTVDLWLSTGVLVLCFIALFWGASWMHEDPQNELSSLLFVVAIISQRGPPYDIMWLSGRILTFSALIFGYLLFTYFSSAIIVRLLSPPPKIDYTLESLLKNDFAVGAENVSYYYAYFTKYPFKILREIYAKKMTMEDFIPLSEGLTKVRNEQYAFGGDMRILFSAAEKELTDSEKCALEAIDMIPLNIPRSVVLQKESPWDELLSAGYLLFMERGITHRLDRIWSNPQPACLARDFLPVEIYDLYFAFVLLSVGFVVSMIIFGFELHLHKSNRTKLKDSETNGDNDFQEEVQDVFPYLE